ncbi:LOW QUALITY PROTEIN: hypothetical protein HID58_049556, partial [Brassica napus]
KGITSKSEACYCFSPSKAESYVLLQSKIFNIVLCLVIQVPDRSGTDLASLLNLFHLKGFMHSIQPLPATWIEPSIRCSPSFPYWYVRQQSGRRLYVRF